MAIGAGAAAIYGAIWTRKKYKEKKAAVKEGYQQVRSDIKKDVAEIQTGIQTGATDTVKIIYGEIIFRILLAIFAGAGVYFSYKLNRSVSVLDYQYLCFTILSWANMAYVIVEALSHLKKKTFKLLYLASALIIVLAGLQMMKKLEKSENSRETASEKVIGRRN